MCMDIRFIFNLPELLYLRRREDVPNLGNSGKLKMNRISIHIIRREIKRWIRIWSQKFMFTYAFWRKSRFKFLCVQSALKFRFEICAYIDTCLIINSGIAYVHKNRISVITSYYVIAAPSNFSERNQVIYWIRWVSPIAFINYRIYVNMC